MIYVGLDDTDTLDTPGTNKLARYLADRLRSDFSCRMILRHQLLEDPRVPCTRKNGCATILLEPHAGNGDAGKLASALPPVIRAWCPAGSDPGLCIAQQVTDEIIDWGRRCQRELVTQAEARQLAASQGVLLQGLGGSQDGVIGALAAIGLGATANDGRVVYLGDNDSDRLDTTGILSTDEICRRGIDEVRDANSQASITAGVVAVRKRLRPNLRGGQVVLYVTPTGAGRYEDVRVT
jgi:tRNA(Ile2) C34 agmatinyltransferase TiaS